MNVFYNEELCISEILESNILLVLKQATQGFWYFQKAISCLLEIKFHHPILSGNFQTKVLKIHYCSG